MKIKSYKIYKKSTKGREKGITLIALAITIIVLLILAGVTIATLTGENGILTKASESKITTALATIKEGIELDKTANLIANKNITIEQLLADGKIKRTVQAEGETYYIYYAIKDNAYEGMQGLGKGTSTTLRDVFLIDDEFHIKYIDKNGKEYGDEIEEKILEDETEIRFASKAFSEYISKISGVTETEMKFKWMKNQTGLTIDDASITSLEDLVFFPNLTALSLNYMTLENLSGIENCKKLISLQLRYSNISKIEEISNCTNLESLLVVTGTIENFNGLNNCIKLSSINYGGKIDFSNFIDNIKNLKQLKMIAVSYAHENINSIKELEKLSCTSLEILRLSDNNISKIEGIEKFTSLKSLDLANNQITDITPISTIASSLTTLNLKGNTAIDGNRNNYTGERLIALNKIGEVLNRNGNIYLDSDKLGLFTN